LSPADSHAALDGLLEAMQQRLALMPEVARWKWNAGRAVADPARETELLERVARQSDAHGLDPAFTRAFFADQIEAAKLVQENAFRRWKEEGHGPFAEVTDLAVLRRRIDTLNEDLLTALARMRSPSPGQPTPVQIQQRAREVLMGDFLDETVRRTALRALTHLDKQLRN
jgi:chorismate mutase-like protein